MKIFAKIIFKSATLNLLSKFVALISHFYYIKNILPTLGTEHFGLWMTLLSLLIIINYLDLGIINSLLNKITYNYSKTNMPWSIYSATIITVSLIASLGIILSFNTMAHAIDIKNLLNINKIENISHIKNIIALFSLQAAFAFMINAYGSIYNAKNYGWISNLILLTVNSLNLIGIFVITNEEYNLTDIILISIYSHSIGLILYVKLFMAEKIKIDLKSTKRTFKIIKTARTTGAKFMIIQIGVLLLFALDISAISIIKGASHVIDYSIIQKIYAPAIILTSVINSPLWALYADGIARKNYTTTTKLFTKYLTIISIAVVLYMTIIEILKIDIYTHLNLKKSEVTTQMMHHQALFTLLFCINNCFCTLSNGISNLSPQVKFYIFIILILFPVKILTLHMYDINTMLCITNILFSIGLIPFCAKTIGQLKNIK